MKRRPIRKSSSEQAFYRELEAKMPLSQADYDRLRHAVGLDDEPETMSPVPGPSRRRRAPALTAVAATLAVVSVLSLAGVWIADRLRHPSPVLPPLGESESLPSHDTSLDTLPETAPDSETVFADAPEEMVIDGITYRKSNSYLGADEIGEVLLKISGQSREEVLCCYTVRRISVDRGVAVLWRERYILYEVMPSVPRLETE